MTIRDRAQAALDRADCATPGPWLRPFDDGALTAAIRPAQSLLALDADGMAVVDDRDDADFIVAARTDLPDFAAALLRILSPEMREQIARTLYGGGGLTAEAAAVKADDVMRLIERVAEGESR